MLEITIKKIVVAAALIVTASACTASTELEKSDEETSTDSQNLDSSEQATSNENPQSKQDQVSEAKEVRITEVVDTNGLISLPNEETYWQGTFKGQKFDMILATRTVKDQEIVLGSFAFDGKSSQKIAGTGTAEGAEVNMFDEGGEVIETFTLAVKEGKLTAEGLTAEAINSETTTLFTSSDEPAGFYGWSVEQSYVNYHMKIETPGNERLAHFNITAPNGNLGSSGKDGFYLIGGITGEDYDSYSAREGQDFLDCGLEFDFFEDVVLVTTAPDKLECGFGNGVFADGLYPARTF